MTWADALESWSDAGSENAMCTARVSGVIPAEGGRLTQNIFGCCSSDEGRVDHDGLVSHEVRLDMENVGKGRSFSRGCVEAECPKYIFKSPRLLLREP